MPEDQLSAGFQPGDRQRGRTLLAALAVLALSTPAWQVLRTDTGLLPLSAAQTERGAGPAPHADLGSIRPVRLPRAGLERVGHGIRPGIYVTRGNRACTWARLTGGGGGFPYDVVIGAQLHGTGTIAIAPTDAAFFHAGCRQLHRVADLPPEPAQRGR